jgi:hypothetical protein
MMQRILLTVPLVDGAVVVKALAVIGGAVIGAYLIGWFTQLLVRVLTAQKMPPWPLRFVRLLGGIAAGLLVMATLSWTGGGSWGFGGRSTGLGTGDGSKSNDDDKGKDKADLKEVPPASPETLRIEVLGDPALKKIAGATFDARRCYRLAEEKEPKLQTLAEMEKYISDRLKEEPPLHRIVLVLYRDSPDRKVGRVDDLKTWAEDLPIPGSKEKVRVDLSLPANEAPIR